MASSFSLTDAQAISEALVEPACLVYWNDILLLTISPETLNMVQTMVPAQRKKSKKTVNALKLGLLWNLVLAFKIRSLKPNTVHMLHLHSEVPQLLADLEFHMNLSQRGREKEFEEQMWSKYLGQDLTASFCISFFQEVHALRITILMCAPFAGWRVYPLLLDFQRRCPMKFTPSKHTLLYRWETMV